MARQARCCGTTTASSTRTSDERPASRLPADAPSHLLSFWFIGSGFWLLSAACTVLHANQKRGTLATTGPYARVRHPQYIGFISIMFGFLMQWPTILTLAMFPILCFMYVRLAVNEEERAQRVFGDQWHRYAARTPRWIPRVGASTTEAGG